MNKQQKFSIRKYSVGVASVVIGSLLFGSHAVLAEEVVLNNTVEEENKVELETVELTDKEKEAVNTGIDIEKKTSDSYSIEEVEETTLLGELAFKLPRSLSSERNALISAVDVAEKEFFANTLTYESDQKLDTLLVEARNLLVKDDESQFIEKSKEIEAAIQINSVREKYSKLKGQAYYELYVYRRGWTYESYTQLKNIYDETLAIEATTDEALKYEKATIFGQREKVARLSDEVMSRLSSKLEVAISKLVLNPERDRLRTALGELYEKKYYTDQYTPESISRLSEEINKFYFKQEPRPEEYEEYARRLNEAENLLVEIPFVKERRELKKLRDYAYNITLTNIQERSLKELTSAKDDASTLLAQDNSEYKELEIAIENLKKVINHVEWKNPKDFSNDLVKKITIEKEKVNLKDDQFLEVTVELQPISKGTLFLETRLLDRRDLTGFDNQMGRYSYQRLTPLKQEGDKYTFVVPLYKFHHTGKYYMWLTFSPEKGERKFSKVPYLIDVQGGYDYDGTHTRSFVTRTSLNKHTFLAGDNVIFKSNYYWVSEIQNTLFDIYKVGETKPIKRIRSDYMGGNFRFDLLEKDYESVFRPTLYSAFKIDDTFTEGEYEIRPADLTDTTMYNRTTVTFDMLDRYVQRFKVVKPHKEHIVLEGTMEKDGVYTFADNDRSTDVKVKVDKNIAEAKNIFALQVEALDGALPVLGGKAYRAFEVDFIDRDGKVIKFSDAHARVYIPVKEEVVAAYHIKGNSKEAVPFVMSEDKQGVWIDVEHFSTYAIEFASAVSPKPTDDAHKVKDLDKNPKPNGNAPVTPGSNGPTTPSKPEAKPAQPIAKPKPKADTAEKTQEAPQPSATANTTVAAPSAPAAVAQATPAPKGETLPETGEASTAWFTLASVAVLASLGLVVTKRPEDV